LTRGSESSDVILISNFRWSLFVRCAQSRRLCDICRVPTLLALLS